MKDKKSFVQEKYLKNIRCQWNQQMIEKNSNHENYLSNSLGNNDCLMKYTTSGRRSRYSSIHSGLYWNRLNKYQLYLLYPEITYYLLPIETYTFLINNKNQRDRNADNWSTYLKNVSPNITRAGTNDTISERCDECIDFTIITIRNNASISNFGGGFRWKSEYSWCIIEVKMFIRIRYLAANQGLNSYENVLFFPNYINHVKISQNVLTFQPKTDSILIVITYSSV
ncbi:hypothetical protein AGLY_009267 [Aphis glycines]|uniref:Uncharacterized protein n=1 Tax=Aphis glycines TaxID=307491 RepID=A0A6G0TI69_APHGL|nr:hypothetical protein AGLY_009267 [Aphis glycines]